MTKQGGSLFIAIITKGEIMDRKSKLENLINLKKKKDQLENRNMQVENYL
ncbi:hypothetical protein HMPREF0391_10014 [Finegoldia magna ATCC 53516]|uniref:Uncharacterized protein n=1 Tax=Finegoldia magna ATCC 53516 TaxID=525282 RepID=D6S6E2_FINMA|nr:hypothetical protein HMPREF0391_10014 [Finegoldia magna ATCC 53516]